MNHANAYVMCVSVCVCVPIRTVLHELGHSERDCESEHGEKDHGVFE
jgi:hypothetical protein